MTHLGQRLSALIDGELGGDERDRVLGHLARCGGCREEAAALRTLKRRMNALGEAAAGAGLTGRLMGLNDSGESGVWPQAPASWALGGRDTRPEPRAGRYFLAASFAVFLAGIGTAAFIAGGDPQAQAPAVRVTPQVGVYLLEHDDMSGLYMNGLFANGSAQPRTGESGSGEGRSSPLP
jgi:anti-sigma factor RsiW